MAVDTTPRASFENPRFHGTRPVSDGAMGRVGAGGVAHTLTTAMAGADNDLDLTARRPGDVPATPAVEFTDPGVFSGVRRVVRGGTVGSITISPSSGTDFHLCSIGAGEVQNSLSVELVDPGRANRPLRVFVDGKKITVWLETNSSSVLQTTAAEVVAAINQNVRAAELVVAYITEASAGAVDGVADTNLAGGTDDLGLTQVLLDTDGAGAITTTGDQLADALRSANFLVENATGNDGSGTVTALARTDLEGGSDPIGVKSRGVENCVELEDQSERGFHHNKDQRRLQPEKMTTRSDAIRRVKEAERDITREKVAQEVQHSSVGRVV